VPACMPERMLQNRDSTTVASFDLFTEELHFLSPGGYRLSLRL
jgi:hypothetical protein